MQSRPKTGVSVPVQEQRHRMDMQAMPEGIMPCHDMMMML